MSDLGSRRQKTVVTNLVHPRRRHEGHQPGNEIEWRQNLVRCTVTPRSREAQANATVVELFESIVGKRRFENIVAQSLESFSILLRDSARGMQVESMRGTLASGGMVLIAGAVNSAELQHPLSGVVAEQCGALDRRRGTIDEQWID